MKKRGRRHDHYRNPNAHALALFGAARLSVEDQAKRAMACACAVEDIARGRAEWKTVFDMVNLIEALCQQPQIARGAGEFVEKLQTTVAEVAGRFKAGQRALHAAELGTLREGVALYTELLGLCSHREYADAVIKVERRLHNALRGNVAPGALVVDAEEVCA